MPRCIEDTQRLEKVVKDSLLRSGPRKSLVKGERFIRETELKPE